MEISAFHPAVAAADVSAQWPSPGFPHRPLRTIAVVVACNRPVMVERLLVALRSQDVALHAIIVVNNGADAETPAICLRYGVRHVASLANIGGAGGFALGCALALAQDPDFIWMWDDDGYPEGADCLRTLIGRQQASGVAIASPLVVDVDNPGRSAFPFRFGMKVISERAALVSRDVLSGAVHLFNGALIPASTFHRFGLPDTRLFIRGDEVDFMLRVRGGGGEVATFTRAVARHPSSAAEIFPLLGGIFHATCPADPIRRRLQFRNRGYVFRRHGLWHLLAADVVRYGIFFLARARPDLNGLRDWLAATWDGVRERLGRPDPR